MATDVLCVPMVCLSVQGRKNSAPQGSACVDFHSGEYSKVIEDIRVAKLQEALGGGEDVALQFQLEFWEEALNETIMAEEKRGAHCEGVVATLSPGFAAIRTMTATEPDIMPESLRNDLAAVAAIVDPSGCQLCVVEAAVEKAQGSRDSLFRPFRVTDIGMKLLEVATQYIHDVKAHDADADKFASCWKGLAVLCAKYPKVVKRPIEGVLEPTTESNGLGSFLKSCTAGLVELQGFKKQSTIRAAACCMEQKAGLTLEQAMEKLLGAITDATRCVAGAWRVSCLAAVQDPLKQVPMNLAPTFKKLDASLELFHGFLDDALQHDFVRAQLGPSIAHLKGLSQAVVDGCRVALELRTTGAKDTDGLVIKLNSALHTWFRALQAEAPGVGQSGVLDASCASGFATFAITEFLLPLKEVYDNLQGTFKKQNNHKWSDMEALALRQGLKDLPEWSTLRHITHADADCFFPLKPNMMPSVSVMKSVVPCLDKFVKTAYAEAFQANFQTAISTGTSLGKVGPALVLENYSRLCKAQATAAGAIKELITMQGKRLLDCLEAKENFAKVLLSRMSHMSDAISNFTTFMQAASATEAVPLEDVSESAQRIWEYMSTCAQQVNEYSKEFEACVADDGI